MYQRDVSAGVTSMLDSRLWKYNATVNLNTRMKSLQLQNRPIRLNRVVVSVSGVGEMSDTHSIRLLVGVRVRTTMIYRAP